MKPFLAMILTLLFCSLSLAAAPVKPSALPPALTAEESRYAEYLAGVLILRSSTDMDSTARAAWYRRLEKITGFNVAKARIFGDRYSTDPESFGKILTETQNRLSLP